MRTAQPRELGTNVAVDRRLCGPRARAAGALTGPIGAGVSAVVVRNGSLRTAACPCAPSTTTRRGVRPRQARSTARTARRGRLQPTDPYSRHANARFAAVLTPGLRRKFQQCITGSGECASPLALLIAAASIALSACGSSSGGDANSLLKQTFSGTHTVTSGNLTFSLTVNPSGSRTLSGPITLSFGGPFQSRGKGQAAGVELQHQHRRIRPLRIARDPLDRYERVRHAAGDQLPASGGDVPEARVELRPGGVLAGRRIERRHAVEARHRSAALAREPVGCRPRKPSAARIRRTSAPVSTSRRCWRTSTRSCRRPHRSASLARPSSRAASRTRRAAGSQARSRTRQSTSGRETATRPCASCRSR